LDKTEKGKITEIGTIPNSWDILPLDDLCGKTEQTDPSRKPNEEIEYIDVSSISNDLFQIINTTRYKGRYAPGRAKKKILCNDVLYATVRPSLKRIAMVPKALDGEICSTAFCVLRALPNKINSRYLYHYMLTENINRRIVNLERGSNYPAVLDSDILKQPIPVPDIPIQEKIANILDRSDMVVLEEKAYLAKLIKIKAGLMHDLLTGNKRVKVGG